jgi:predicted nucleic acid-binding protein
MVREWIHSPPTWLSVDDRPWGPRSPVLDPGEADAISLALALRADAILIDENRGRNEARRLGLRPLGVIGVLEQAASRDLVDLAAILRQLVSATNFRISNRVLDEVLERDRTRRSRNPGLDP